jgi:hypothetical protein
MKILGLGVCGPGEADNYLEETLKEFKRLCDDVIICLCNAGPKEEAYMKKYGIRYYHDNREWGYSQPDIKTDLLNKAVKLKADWHLVLDMDETLPTVDRKTLEELTNGRLACQFHVVNLWNDEQHYMKGLGFYNVRFYRRLPGMSTQFLRQRVHCGNAPPFFYSRPAKEVYVPHILLHKGLMKKEDRQRKIDRYAVYDSKAECKGQEYYDALALDTTGTEYFEQKVIEELKKEINKF